MQPNQMLLDIISHCMSYLDTKSYHDSATVCRDFQIAQQSPSSFHGESFALSTPFWEYVLSPKQNHSIHALQTFLTKYKFSKKIEIYPIKAIDHAAMNHKLHEKYGEKDMKQVHYWLKQFNMTSTKKYKISRIFKFIQIHFRRLSYVLITDHYHCGNLYGLLPKFNQNDTTLHVKWINGYNSAYSVFCYGLDQLQAMMVGSNNQNDKIKHIIYENVSYGFDAMTNLPHMSGLDKLSIIDCMDFDFGKKYTNKQEHAICRVSELTLTPICNNNSMDTLTYFFENNHSLESLKLSADSYNSGMWTRCKSDIQTMVLSNLRTLSLIIDEHCIKNSDFWSLVNNLKMPGLHSVDTHIQTSDGSNYILRKMKAFCAKNTAVKQVNFKIETDEDAVVKKLIAGIKKMAARKA